MQEIEIRSLSDKKKKRTVREHTEKSTRRDNAHHHAKMLQLCKTLI